MNTQYDSSMGKSWAGRRGRVQLVYQANIVEDALYEQVDGGKSVRCRRIQKAHRLAPAFGTQYRLEFIQYFLVARQFRHSI